MLFCSKARRDEAFRAAGGKSAGFRKRSTRNQLIHPMYVVDYEQETGVSLSQADKGFGNTIYKTHFPVLYAYERDFSFNGGR